MIGSWMNDSGFWIFVKMTGMTEAEGLKTWLPTLAIVGVTSVVVSFILAVLWQTGQPLWAAVGFCVILGAWSWPSGPVLCPRRPDVCSDAVRRSSFMPLRAHYKQAGPCRLGLALPLLL